MGGLLPQRQVHLRVLRTRLLPSFRCGSYAGQHVEGTCVLTVPVCVLVSGRAWGLHDEDGTHA